MDRIELAIITLSLWIKRVQQGFGIEDPEEIEKILRGEDIGIRHADT